MTKHDTPPSSHASPTEALTRGAVEAARLIRVSCMYRPGLLVLSRRSANRPWRRELQESDSLLPLHTEIPLLEGHSYSCLMIRSRRAAGDCQSRASLAPPRALLSAIPLFAIY